MKKKLLTLFFFYLTVSVIAQENLLEHEKIILSTKDIIHAVMLFSGILIMAYYLYVVHQQNKMKLSLAISLNNKLANENKNEQKQGNHVYHTAVPANQYQLTIVM